MLTNLPKKMFLLIYFILLSPGISFFLSKEHRVAPFTFRNNFLHIMNSHFSHIKTQLKDKQILVDTLSGIGLDVTSHANTTLISGYNGEKTPAEISIKQKNGKDIGFYYNGETYELVSDLHYWCLDVPVETFLEKINKEYTINLVLKDTQDNGFSIDSFDINHQTGIVEIEVSRYNL